MYKWSYASYVQIFNLITVDKNQEFIDKIYNMSDSVLKKAAIENIEKRL